MRGDRYNKNGVGGWVNGLKEGEGLTSTSWWLQNSHGDVKCSAGSKVNKIVLTMSGARRGLDLLGDHFLRCANVDPLCCALV